MVDKKITELNNITGANLADDDEFVVVDISGDETKSVTRAEFFKNTPSIGIGTTSPTSKLQVNDPASAKIRCVDTTDFFYTDYGRDGIDAYTNTNTGAPILLKTGGSEKARIDSTGNLLVGISAIEGSGGTTIHGVGYITTNRGSTGSAAHHVFMNPNGVVGSIQTSTTSTTYNTSSDYRLKEDWRDIDAPSAKLMALKPVNFGWKVDGTRTDGFLAHELAEVLPYAVTGEKDAVDEDGNFEMQSVDHSKVVPLLTAALQEAIKKIDALEMRLAKLEG